MQGQAFAFLLVLCRCSAAIMLLPGLAEDGMPAMLRAGLAASMALLLTPTLARALPMEPAGFAELARLLAVELLAGGLLGWLARLVTLAFQAAGQLASVFTGLSSILQPDTAFGAQGMALGRLFGLFAAVLVFDTGLYALPLQALSGSYAALPAGEWPAAADLASLALRATTAHFRLALQFAAPFILAGTLWQFGLGLLARLVPQLQIYFATLPGQVLGGLVLLAAVSLPLATSLRAALRSAWSVLPGY